MSDFSISEFVIDGDNVPLDIVDKILKHHINVIQPIRDNLGCAIWPSEHSGFRRVNWEIQHGRSGTSEHCFKGKGAVDYTCRNKWQLELLFKELKKSKYMRVCYYPNSLFIHCDYKGDKKLSFICNDNKNWIRE